jgi:hypothetical protein
VLETTIDGGHFRSVFRTTKVIRGSKQPGVYRLDPDYPAYLGFAYAALEGAARLHSDVEKVDFVIEKKTGVSHRLQEFHDGLPDILRADGRGDLAALVGELIPGSKERVPLQAADFLVWHRRRDKTGEATADDRLRIHRMIHGRHGVTNRLDNDDISEMGTRAAVNSQPSPFKRVSGAFRGSI